MNTDCLTAIAEFAGSKQATKISPFFAKKMFPSTVLIHNYKQLSQFRKWAQLFDTSNLVEVRIVIDETAFHEQVILTGEVQKNPEHPDGLFVDEPIGWVPASVKKLTLNNQIEAPIEIPDTVEELVIERCDNWGLGQVINVPDSVRALHLLDGFEGLIGHWPANLETLTIKGWYPGGRHPSPIQGLPDTIKKMVVASHLNIEIRHWPASLEKIEFVGEPEENGWSIETSGLQDEIEVTISRIPSNTEEQPFDFDDYEDPRVEMWYL